MNTTDKNHLDISNDDGFFMTVLNNRLVRHHNEPERLAQELINTQKLYDLSDTQDRIIEHLILSLDVDIYTEKKEQEIKDKIHIEVYNKLNHVFSEFNNEMSDIYENFPERFHDEIKGYSLQLMYKGEAV